MNEQRCLLRLLCVSAATLSAVSCPLPGSHAGKGAVLRVCADPNNLPFSNAAGQGFENRIAQVLAQELHASVEYAWWPQRRGFVRHTLQSGACDALIGVPTAFPRVLATRPYYRSTYVFVWRRGARPVRSFDDPALRRLRVGVHLVGDDGANTPPAHSLARRGIVDNVRGYTLYGDYSRPDPPARLLEALAAGDIDVAVAWGPLAGYFARRQKTPLELAPVSPPREPSLPLAFDIGLGVRPGDTALRDRLQAALDARRTEVDRILADYGVPRLDVPANGNGATEPQTTQRTQGHFG